jgi:TPR repeat protein
MAAHYYDLSANQGNLFAQFIQAVRFHYGKGGAINLGIAAHYYKLAADHRDFETEYFSKLHLFPTELQNGLAIKTTQRKLSAGHINAIAQLSFAHFLEEGIGTEKDPILAAKYYEMASESIPFSCASYGWCLQHGIGVAINFTEAAAFFQKAADYDNSDGANSFGICLEHGLGVDRDVRRSVLYYRTAASQNHPSGMNNFGRCLEYGQGIERNPIRAAKYYRMSADLKNAEG